MQKRGQGFILFPYLAAKIDKLITNYHIFLAYTVFETSPNLAYYVQ